MTLDALGNQPMTVGSIIDLQSLKDSIHFLSECDVLEIRLDHLHPHLPECPNWNEFLLPWANRLLLTARCPNEGGANSLSFEIRESMLERHLSKATYLDVECQLMTCYESLIHTAHAQKVKVIASYHDFFKTPSIGHLEGLAENAFANGADIVKFAFRLESFKDIELGLDVLQLALPGPISIMGMGSLGPVSRLLYAQHGSVLNYGYLGHTETAPGQWPASLLKLGIQHLTLINPKRAR